MTKQPLFVDEQTKLSAEVMVREILTRTFPEDKVPNNEDDFSYEKEFNDYVNFNKLIRTKFFESVLNIQKNEIGTDLLCGVRRKG